MELMWLGKSKEFPLLQDLVRKILQATSDLYLQFILEPMAFPDIVSWFREIGQPLIDTVCYMTRTFAFYIHKEKQISLGRWPGSGYLKKSKNMNITSTNTISFSAPVKSSNTTTTICNTAIPSSDKRTSSSFSTSTVSTTTIMPSSLCANTSCNHEQHPVSCHEVCVGPVPAPTINSALRFRYP